MQAVKLSATVGADRRLELELPDDIAPGDVEVIVLAMRQPAPTGQPLTRERARAKLLAAGALVTTRRAPEGVEPLSPEALREVGRLPPGARPSADLIDEDRGEW